MENLEEKISLLSRTLDTQSQREEDTIRRYESEICRKEDLIKTMNEEFVDEIKILKQEQLKVVSLEKQNLILEEKISNLKSFNAALKIEIKEFQKIYENESAGWEKIKKIYEDTLQKNTEIKRKNKSKDMSNLDVSSVQLKVSEVLEVPSFSDDGVVGYIDERRSFLEEMKKSFDKSLKIIHAED